ncbi:dTMP kinase [Aerophototrophica crusticola]|uniref:Thymidylate kinase n=1 Tax=Aerophototrophica crusticola TaxID=1709002 RepID=A0A858R5V9_9PROT|nr:dTMP kinase [Rhodospirillaceae bacterium B3]
MARGRFITLEGGEGAGKSTQLRLLAEALRGAGVPVVTTREPGGSPGAEEIRALLVTGKPGRWQPLTEALLLNAARHQHIAETVEPALAAGTWVLCDRYADSTFAYQGAGHGLDPGVLRTLHAIATGGLTPDLTFVFDIDPAVGLTRAASRRGTEDRYEQMDLAFHGRLRDAYLALARSEPARCLLVDSSRSVEAIQSDLRAALRDRLGLPL